MSQLFSSPFLCGFVPLSTPSGARARLPEAGSGVLLSKEVAEFRPMPPLAPKGPGAGEALAAAPIAVVMSWIFFLLTTDMLFSSMVSLMLPAIYASYGFAFDMLVRFVSRSEAWPVGGSAAPAPPNCIGIYKLIRPRGALPMEASGIFGTILLLFDDCWLRLVSISPL